MIRRLVTLVLALALLLPAAARAESDAGGTVAHFCDGLIDVMKKGPALGFRGREARLLPLVSTAYDMMAMTRGTLGPAAERLTPAETNDLADVYTRFSAAVYADQFASWKGERCEVGTPHPTPDGRVVVPSRFVSPGGTGTSIDYVLHQDNGAWKIVDVLFNGTISQVAVRRSEFVSVLRRDGFKGLVAMIQAKTKALEAQ